MWLANNLCSKRNLAGVQIDKQFGRPTMRCKEAKGNAGMKLFLFIQVFNLLAGC